MLAVFGGVLLLIAFPEKGISSFTGCLNPEDKSPETSCESSLTDMEPAAAMGCVNICNLTSNLPVIPYQKLTDLYYLSRGGFGTVFKAQHSDWRTTVAIKCLKLDSPVGER